MLVLPSCLVSSAGRGDSPLSVTSPDPEGDGPAPLLHALCDRALGFPAAIPSNCQTSKQQTCTYLEVSTTWEDQAVIRASVSHMWMRTMVPTAGHHGAIPQRLARQVLPEKKDEFGPWGESGPLLGAGALTVSQMHPSGVYLLGGYLSGCV